jgi:hypothetical protein
MNVGLSDTMVYALAIDPTSADTLYAGTYSEGVFRTSTGRAFCDFPMDRGSPSVTRSAHLTRSKETPMRLAPMMLAGCFAATVATAAGAAAPPTGTISCSVFSGTSSTRPEGILFSPGINSVPRTVKINARNIGSSCDNAGVVGGKAPITGVALKLTARMPDGTCANLTSASPTFDNARVVLKWRGLNPAGHPMTVSTSHARIATASYDTNAHALDLTTTPITGSAFAGKTVTMHLGFDYFADVFESGCVNASGFVAQGFGNVVPSSVDVQ